MSNIAKTQSKLGFWKRLTQAFEAMEKTETDHMWDEIVRLRAHQSELEKELQTRSHC